ncbi:YceI family protein [Rahnella sp. NRRL B-41462]|uniref:YceI family protein n=1 Tax=Rahnella sp. NRRL B-41462 TaxID=1610579 RepID=UPI000DD4E2C2|nr:YceI family protein [Rahnella sp. NRRL B-41462]
MLRAFLFILSMGYASLSFSGTPEHYVINADRTTITLSWVMLSTHPSQANLSQVSGDAFLDHQQNMQNHIDVRIPVSSLEASNLLLTHQLKSSMFFDENRYPWVTFTSQKVTQSGNGQFKIFGMLTIKNIQRPVVLDAVMNDASAKSLILHAHTAISRSAFAMDSLLSLVGDTINIDIDIAAKPYKA